MASQTSSPRMRAVRRVMVSQLRPGQTPPQYRKTKHLIGSPSMRAGSDQKNQGIISLPFFSLGALSFPESACEERWHPFGKCRLRHGRDRVGAQVDVEDGRG